MCANAFAFVLWLRAYLFGYRFGCFFYLFFFSLFESGCFEHFPITIITTGGDVICILAMPWNFMQKPIGFNLSSFIIFSIAVNFVCFGAFYIFDLRHT